GLSIIVGQHMSKSSVPLLAQTTTKKLRQEPPRREVLDPNRHTNNTFAPPSSPSQGSVINRGASGGNETHAPDNHGAAENPAPTPGDEKRVFGLNYVIIQSYPKEEEKMAIDAMNFLNKEGIRCTMETKVRGYLPITVVGL